MSPARAPIVIAGNSVDQPLPILITKADGSKETLRTVEDVEAYFGAGSAIHVWVAERCRPPLSEAQIAERHAREEEGRRLEQRVSIGYAFAAVGECIALVEAHAVALHDADLTSTDACPRGDLREWRAMAFRSLAFLYDRTPELLPIGPAVHSDCHGDDL